MSTATTTSLRPRFYGRDSPGSPARTLARLKASSLKLEITESAYIGDVSSAAATLKRLQSLGVEWSIDDFGTGYSSLNYLHQLQADTVKVDRSFVSRMGADVNGSEMVSAIVALGAEHGHGRRG